MHATEWVFGAWGRILAGYTPALSVEITRECPLRCPGCYAYNDEHLGGAVTLREVRDFKGQELVDGVLALIDRQRPLHVSIVGGEPLVRYRELTTLLPLLSQRGIHVQLVTSAVREIPQQWRDLFRLSIVVSIDGLQPEHDARRTSCSAGRPSIDTTTERRGIDAQAIGIGRTALVTTCTCRPRADNWGSNTSSSRKRTSGSPPTIDTWSGLW